MLSSGHTQSSEEMGKNVNDKMIAAVGIHINCLMEGVLQSARISSKGVSGCFEMLKDEKKFSR